MSPWFSANIGLPEWTDGTEKQMYQHSHSPTTRLGKWAKENFAVTMSHFLPPWEVWAPKQIK